MGGLLPMPPSSAYCVQRSDSISSAAARNWRMAASPFVSGPELVFDSSEVCPDSDVCANSLRPPRTVAPAMAPPAARLYLRKERRFLVRDGLTSRILHLLDCAHVAHGSNRTVRLVCEKSGLELP